MISSRSFVCYRNTHNTDMLSLLVLSVYGLLLICGGAIAAAAGGSSEETMDVDKTSTAINIFSSRFAKEVDTGVSTISSPLSAEIVLGLVALGSSNESHDEILSSLSFPDDNALRTGFSAVSSKLKKVKGVTFNMANKVYIKSGAYELKEAFRSDAEKVFNAEVEKINFDDSANAAKFINAWVEGKTNNKIKNLMSPDKLSSDTRLVLINALYFKGSWKSKFDAQATKEMPFHVNSKKTINIPFMNMERSFKYGQNKELNAKILELPYEGDEASMLIVLPNEVDGLGSVLQKLAGGVDLTQVQKDMRQVKVQVSLPKFKIETEIDLKTLLPKLGVSTIFDSGKSQLNKMIDEPLFVSHAIQKAFIEVNEEGAEAAAATAMGMMVMSAIIEPPRQEFKVDRPFLAAVRVGQSYPFWAAVRNP